MSKTAWGEINLNVGKALANGAMATTLTSIGVIKEDTITITTTDGTTYELKKSGGTLIDKLQGEPTLTIGVTVVGLAAATPFWVTESDGEGDAQRTKVKSLVCSDKYSVSMAALVVGSEFIEMPNCSVTAKPVFSETLGWTAEITFELVKNTEGVIFQFGTVPAAS